MHPLQIFPLFFNGHWNLTLLLTIYSWKGYHMRRFMRKGPGRHDTWFPVICIWNHLLKKAAAIGFSFKERFLRFQLLFLDFYHFHHVIWRMKWAKKLKTKNGQNMSSRPLAHDAAHIIPCFHWLMWWGGHLFALNKSKLSCIVLHENSIEYPKGSNPFVQESKNQEDLVCHEHY